MTSVTSVYVSVISNLCVMMSIKEKTKMVVSPVYIIGRLTWSAPIWHVPTWCSLMLHHHFKKAKRDWTENLAIYCDCYPSLVSNSFLLLNKTSKRSRQAKNFILSGYKYIAAHDWEKMCAPKCVPGNNVVCKFVGEITWGRFVFCFS